MTENQPPNASQSAGLASMFRAWWERDCNPTQFIRDGLIVLDANTLLHLYRVTPTARKQILSVLHELRNKMWIPHQAALEFHRNRIDVVTSRMSQFLDMRRSLQQTSTKAVSEIRNTVSKFEAFRNAIMTERGWDPESQGLDENSLKERLNGVMDPALGELAALEAEHDLRPGDVLSDDPVLARLDQITAGRVGSPYSPTKIRQLVQEAFEFRFPSRIPPGYEDATRKPTPYQAAGDYILWQQVIDRASSAPQPKLIALVTNDVKEDWWVLDGKGRPERARPELRQELLEHSGSDMILMTLSHFLEVASEQLPGQVSEDTVQEVRTSEIETQVDVIVDALLSSSYKYNQKPNLLLLSEFQLEHLIRRLFESMGYSTHVSAPRMDRGFDIVAHDTSPEDRKVIIEVKRYIHPVTSEIVRAFYGAVIHEEADGGIIVTTSRFTMGAKAFARDKPLELIEGPVLLGLLREHLGIDATISSSPPNV